MMSLSGSECGPVTIYFLAGDEHEGQKTVVFPFISGVTANLLRATVLIGIS